MTYTTLMVQLEPGQSNAGLLQITGDLAERFHAGVIGIALYQPMQILYNDAMIAGDFIQADREETEKEVKAAEAEFRGALHSRVDSLEWRSAVTYTSLSNYLVCEARSADLVITMVEPNGSLFVPSRHVVMGDLVMQLGRPMLIVPRAAEKLGLERIVVGWKDTRETRRAVLDAVPFLKQATHVFLVEIAPEDEQTAAHARLADVASWLKRHGVVAEASVISSTGEDAAQLNSIAQQQQADLVVAGAYGHSRLREWVLGGVTRDLLLHANWCSFISH